MSNNIILIKYSSLCNKCANSSCDYLSFELVKIFDSKEELFKYLNTEFDIDAIVNIDSQEKIALGDKFNELLNKYNKIINAKYNHGLKLQKNGALCDSS
jgi:hypothetical protein